MLGPAALTACLIPPPLRLGVGRGAGAGRGVGAGAARRTMLRAEDLLTPVCRAILAGLAPRAAILRARLRLAIVLFSEVVLNPLHN